MASQTQSATSDDWIEKARAMNLSAANFDLSVVKPGDVGLTREEFHEALEKASEPEEEGVE